MRDLCDRIIKHFRIIKQLGKGGMGVVYKALDLHLDRYVALKFLPPEFSLNEINKQLFINEARSASALQHNNICTIHEIGQNEDGQLFIVMDYYEGQTLKVLIDEWKTNEPAQPDNEVNKGQQIDENKLKPGLSIGEIINIIKQIAEGLREAHASNIIHRDIKPANIFITKDKSVKILDFGLAILAQETVTESSYPAGTIAYMSPEQIKGEHLDQRTDIWSLGVVLFEMLAGIKPFQSNYPAALIYSILNEDYEPLGKAAPDTPEEIISLCDACLLKDKDARIQSAEDLINAINNYENEKIIIPIRKYKSFKKKVLIGASISLVFLAAALYMYNELVLNKLPSDGKIKIGVLPFQNFISDKSTSDWPILIQSLFTSELGRLGNISVIDFLSINGLIESSFGRSPPKRNPEFYKVLQKFESSFLVDGAILQTKDGTNINANILNPSTGQVTFSTAAIIKDTEELTAGIKKLSEAILNFLEVEEMKSMEGSELTTWISGNSENLEAIKSFLQACQYIYRGEPGGEKYLRRAIELDSNFISARIWLVSGLMQRGKKEEVEKHFSILQKLEANANSFEKAMIDWCQAFINKDLNNQAKALEVALKYSPSNNILLVNLAIVKYDMDDHYGALEALSSPIKMRWHYPPVYLLNTLCYIGLKKYDAALEFAEDHLDIKPVPPETYALLSALHLREGNKSEADNYLKQATSSFLQQKFSWDEINLNLGNVYLDVELYAQAVEYYKKVLESNPNSARVHEKLGRAYYNLKDKTAALSEFNEAIKIDSSFSNPHFMIAKIVDEMGENSHAINHYSSFLKLDSLSKNAGEAKSRIKQLTKLISGEKTNH